MKNAKLLFLLDLIANNLSFTQEQKAIYSEKLLEMSDEDVVEELSILAYLSLHNDPLKHYCF